MSSCASRRAGTLTSSAATEPVAACGSRGLGQPVAAERVVVEQAVPVRAVHRAATDADVPSRTSSSAHATDPAVVDLVAGQRLSQLPQHLLGRTRCRRPEARARRPRLRVFRRGRRCAGTASGSRRRCRAPACRLRRARRPRRPARARAARPGRRRWPCCRGSRTTSASATVGRVGGPADQHPGLAGQRLDVGGVRDAGQPDRGHPQPVRAARRCGAPTTRSATTDSESSVSSHSSSTYGSTP